MVLMPPAANALPHQLQLEAHLFRIRQHLRHDQPHLLDVALDLTPQAVGQPRAPNLVEEAAALRGPLSGEPLLRAPHLGDLHPGLQGALGAAGADFVQEVHALLLRAQRLGPRDVHAAVVVALLRQPVLDAPAREDRVGLRPRGSLGHALRELQARLHAHARGLATLVHGHEYLDRALVPLGRTAQHHGCAPQARLRVGAGNAGRL
mmetsp:Transcript_23747/g.71338  ORF Transcript_23747/g.71338 Transcript_23747/m.71338 type:complete len:206 (-) Transcript_23747:53-670(-)